MSTTDLGLVSIKLLTDSFADQVPHEWRGPTIDVNHDIYSCITYITNHYRSNRVVVAPAISHGMLHRIEKSDTGMKMARIVHHT